MKARSVTITAGLRNISTLVVVGTGDFHGDGIRATFSARRQRQVGDLGHRATVTSAWGVGMCLDCSVVGTVDYNADEADSSCATPASYGGMANERPRQSSSSRSRHYARLVGGRNRYFMPTADLHSLRDTTAISIWS